MPSATGWAPDLTPYFKLDGSRTITGATILNNTLNVSGLLTLGAGAAVTGSIIASGDITAGGVFTGQTAALSRTLSVTQPLLYGLTTYVQSAPSGAQTDLAGLYNTAYHLGSGLLTFLEGAQFYTRATGPVGTHYGQYTHADSRAGVTSLYGGYIEADHQAGAISGSMTGLYVSADLASGSSTPTLVGLDVVIVPTGTVSGAAYALRTAGGSHLLQGDIIQNGTSKIVGGAATTSDLILQSTTANGTVASGKGILFKVGNAGGTTAITIKNDGKVGIGESNPRAALEVGDGNGYSGGLFVRSVSGKIANFGGVFEITTGIGPTDVGQGLRVDGTNRKIQFIASAAIVTDSEAFELDTASSNTLFNGPTSGAKTFFRIGQNAEFKPTSGTATLAFTRLAGLVNQTGGANGIVRSLWIDPTITAAADYRALEITPDAGYAIRQTGASAINYFAGAVQLADSNIVLGTATGTKIGTATTQKLGFYNATPVVRPVLATGAGATVDNVITVLQSLGLVGQT